MKLLVSFLARDFLFRARALKAIKRAARFRRDRAAMGAARRTGRRPPAASSADRQPVTDRARFLPPLRLPAPLKASWKPNGLLLVDFSDQLEALSRNRNIKMNI